MSNCSKSAGQKKIKKPSSWIWLEKKQKPPLAFLLLFAFVYGRPRPGSALKCYGAPTTEISLNSLGSGARRVVYGDGGMMK